MKRLIDFTITDKLCEKYQRELKNLSPRTQNVLKDNDLLTLNLFRSYFFNDNCKNSFLYLVQAGVKTNNELIYLLRKTIKTNSKYEAALIQFNNEFKKLSPHAKGLLRTNGLGLFEKFYYVFLNTDEVSIKCSRNRTKETQDEAERFIKLITTSLIFSDNLDQDQVNKTNKTFKNDFKELSPNTKKILSEMGADSYIGFYNSILSESSPFTKILKRFDEQSLIEIFKFRRLYDTVIH